jgi:hypothetical protein
MQRPDSPDAPSASRDALFDKRPRPHGALPRHLQTWLMVGLAVVMLIINLVIGHPSAPRPPDGQAARPSNALKPER